MSKKTPALSEAQRNSLRTAYTALMQLLGVLGHMTKKEKRYEVLHRIDAGFIAMPSTWVHEDSLPQIIKCLKEAYGVEFRSRLALFDCPNTGLEAAFQLQVLDQSLHTLKLPVFMCVPKREERSKYVQVTAKGYRRSPRQVGMYQFSTCAVYPVFPADAPTNAE